MTKQQIAVVLERAETWPQEAQEELVRQSMDIEQEHGLIYQLSDDEREDVQAGLAEIERGEAATDSAVRETFQKLRQA